MKLKTKELLDFEKALLSAYPTKIALKRMLRVQLEENLTRIADGENLGDIIFNLIEWAECQGKLEKLIRGSYAYNPNNPLLRGFVSQFPELPMPKTMKVEPPTEVPKPSTVITELGEPEPDTSTSNETEVGRGKKNTSQRENDEVVDVPDTPPASTQQGGATTVRKEQYIKRYFKKILAKINGASPPNKPKLDERLPEMHKIINYYYYYYIIIMLLLYYFIIIYVLLMRYNIFN